MSVCSSLTQGILAFNISDLVPNGFINAVDTDRKNKTVKMLPSDRISVELQYTVTANTGTTLNDLAGGNTGGLGGLGGGAGSAIGQSIGASLQGDFEPTQSQFIFHICESKTYLNIEITLTKDNIDSGEIYLDNFVIGVFGVTRDKISFSEEEIVSLGRLGSDERGSNPDINGLVQTEINVENNLFIEIIRDERKYIYRADNDIGDNCFLNNSPDDISDKKIRFKSIFTKEENQKPFIEGDKIYVSYIGSSNSIIRHAIYVSSFFFLFPGPYVSRIGQDRVRSWNFKQFSFKSLKNYKDKEIPTINDLENDKKIIEEYGILLKNDSLSIQKRQDLEKERDSKLKLENMICQRLTESFWDSTMNLPYIKGFYIADSRGILKVIVDSGYSYEIVIQAEKIRDQEWWKSFISNFINNNYGLKNGEFDFEDIDSLKSVLQKGFLFDISDHVNSCVVDGGKLGYQKDLAIALLQIKPFIENDISSGLGCSNLDLEHNKVPGRDNYDGSSVKFDIEKMSSNLGGAYFVRDCNVIFNQENLFNQGSSFLQADMFIRTPIFFDKLPVGSRIYMERFSPYIGLDPDGGIWVTTSAVSGDGLSADIHPNGKVAFLTFNDNTNKTLNYHIFDDGRFFWEYSFLREKKDINNDIKKVEDISYNDIKIIGYDRILGNEPGYSNGIPVSTEIGKNNRNIIKIDNIYKEKILSFIDNDGSLVVSGLDQNYIKEIKITYKQIKEIKSGEESSLFFVFPGSESIIDNININLPNRYDIVLNETIQSGYYKDSQFTIKGNGLSFISVEKIEATYVGEQDFLKNKIYAGSSSVCFDKNGNIYIFYEDQQSSFDGYNSFTETDIYGNYLQDNAFNEISCVVSYDQGISWYDFKGIIKTCSDEIVSNPFSVSDKENDIIHLFYVLNNSLFHKIINAKNFNIIDSFIRYKRPFYFDENTEINFGLKGFSDQGKIIRNSVSHLVSGNIENDFLVKQIDISNKRLSLNLSTRFYIPCKDNINKEKYDKEFINEYYSCILDRYGNLLVFYFENEKLYVKKSSNSGFEWFSLLENGLEFFKYKSDLPFVSLDTVFIHYSYFENIIYIIYSVDNMLFLKSIENSIFNFNKEYLYDILKNNEKYNRSIFVLGDVPSDVKQYIKSGSSNIDFPYYISDLDYFNEKMSLQKTLNASYVGSSGFNRFFYRNINGKISAFTMQSNVPVLDMRLVSYG